MKLIELTDEEKQIENDIDLLKPVSNKKRHKIENIITEPRKNKLLSRRILRFLKKMFLLLIVLQITVIHSESISEINPTVEITENSLEKPPNCCDKIKEVFRNLQLYGFWDAISVMMVFIGFVFGLRYLRYSKANIKNLNFRAYAKRFDRNHYPLKVIIEIRNYTGKSVILKDAGFYLSKKIKPDEKASMDSPTRKIEVKFPKESNYNEIDYLLRHKESVLTWIPVDPNQTNEYIDRALDKKDIGKLKMTLVWLEAKPKQQKIYRSV